MSYLRQWVQFHILIGPSYNARFRSNAILPVCLRRIPDRVIWLDVGIVIVASDGGGSWTNEAADAVHDWLKRLVREKVAERRQTSSDKCGHSFDHVPVENRADGYCNAHRSIGEENASKRNLRSSSTATAKPRFVTSKLRTRRAIEAATALRRGQRGPSKNAEEMTYMDPTSITPETAIFRERLIWRLHT